jgi:phage tail sheath protein FI
MAFQVSPGVLVQEKDLTTIIPNVSTSIGGIVIVADKGPCDTIVTVSTEAELVDNFGKPNSSNSASWWTAANFLKYSGTLKVVRAIDETAALNASGTAGILIKNDDIWENTTLTAVGDFAAKTPGVWGNNLKVDVCPSAGAFSGWAHEGLFDIKPGSTDYASDLGGADDEVYIVVSDEDGDITGVAGTVLETFIASKSYDVKSVTGEGMYYKDVLFRSSRYIYWMDHPTATSGTAWGSAVTGAAYLSTEAAYSLSLANGVDGSVTTGDRSEALDEFNDADTVDLNLLISGDADLVFAKDCLDVAATRKDCLAFISPLISDVVGVSNSATQTTNVTDYFNNVSTGFNSSSYSVFDSGWKYMYDTYNDNYIWVPLNGDIAGTCASTDDAADPWFSPAGMSRGNIKGSIKLAFNPTKTQRDTLYKGRINPVVTFPGMGTLLWGDKTAQSKASAFDRINVRRLFMVLEKAISIASRAQLFELNDDITRSNFVAMTEPFLRDVQGRRGITDFKVVCDTSNNTGDVIDRNEFRADIYIKPARSINFITLTFVATRTGVSFSEVGA